MYSKKVDSLYSLVFKYFQTLTTVSSSNKRKSSNNKDASTIEEEDDYSDDEVAPNEYDPEAGGYWDEDGDFHHGFFAEDGEWVETDADGHELDDPPYREEQGRRKSGKNRTRR